MINSFDIGMHSDLAILAAILFLCKFVQIRGLRNTTYLWKMLNLIKHTKFAFKIVRFFDMITIFVTIRPKLMILAAILILCKLDGQDVKIIFGIRHFWIQHAQIDLKSHRYRFFPHLHLRCPYYWNGPSLY